ncbi:MAG: DUF6157 family protein [Thermomicrobiales bacterium]
MATRAGKHTTNYTQTLIATAEDSVAERGTVPPQKLENPSIAYRTWEKIASAPYEHTSDDVIFGVWADRKGIPAGERDAARAEFFSKGQACLRASDLGKKYGWGIHHDEEGRIALYGVESDEYQRLLNDPDVAKTRSMRRARS